MPLDQDEDVSADLPARRRSRQRRSVTVTTVAKAAGVSRAAVSFAYNAPAQLSPETRQRILQIADELGYAPDPVARMLTTRQSGAVGLLMVEPIEAAFADPLTTLFVRGMGQMCDRYGLALTLLPPQRGSSIAAAQSAIIDGAIALGLAQDHPAMVALGQRHLPLVVVDGPASDRWSGVQIDDAHGAYLAAKHLVELGHRRIIILSFESRPPTSFDGGHSTYYVPEQRMEGYRRGLGSAVQAYVVETHSDVESGRLAIMACLTSAQPRHTAILAMSDALAIGALHACQDLGLQVPQDCAIIGFDGIPETAVTTPPLTTIAQPVQEKAALAMQFLLQEIQSETKRPHEHVVLPTRLVLRASTGPAPG